MFNVLKGRGFFTVFSISIFAASSQSLAQVALEEIIVTSQKREQSLQDVQVSVNVLSGEKILDAGITKIEDLQAYVPNLVMSETGIGTNIYIRGIGSGINQGFEQSVGTYIDGTYYGRAQLSRAPFLDLERVEVLRGPQNVLYGKNSLGGALTINTAKPTQDFEGHVAATVGDFGERVVDLVLSGGLTDTVSARLAHRSRDLDGYVQNADLSDEPSRDESTTRLTLAWDASEDLDVSLKLEDGSFDVVGRQIEIVGDEGSLNPALGGATWSQFLAGFGASTSVLNTSQDFVRSSNGDFSQNDTSNITLDLDYRWNDYEINSVTSYVEYDYNERCDCDFTGADVFFVDSREDYSQFSQEIRIESPLGETFEWMAGVYYQTSDLEFEDAFLTTPTSVIGNVLDTILSSDAAFGDAFPTGATGAGQQLAGISVPRTFDQDSDLISGFVQVGWNINDKAKLTIGGRYNSEDKEASRTLTVQDSDGNEIPFNAEFIPGTEVGIDYILGNVLNVVRHDISDGLEEDDFSPSVTFEYAFNDDVQGYANWSRGFKAGGFDVRSNVAPATFDAAGNAIPPPGTVVVNEFNPALSYEVEPGTFEYDQEEATSIELGLKSRLLNGSLEVNLAAFHTEYEDLQVSIFDGTLGFNVGNAAEATSIGVELESRWAVSENLNLRGSLAWLDFEFDDYEDGQATQRQRILTGQNTTDFQGFTNQYVADFSGALAADYVRDIGNDLLFSSTLDLIFTTEYNPSQNVDPEIEQDGYVKLNARVAVSSIDDTWEIALVGKNLTDEDIITYTNDTPLSANLVQSVGFYGFVEPPRAFTVQGTYRF